MKEEIKYRMIDLATELYYACADENLALKLQTAWKKLKLLQESVEKSDWKYAKKELPVILPEENFSERVFAKVEGHKKIAVMRLVKIIDNDTILYKWANCYGNIYGEAYLDDEYEVFQWKYIQF